MISIIIPVYNGAAYIPELIENLERQTKPISNKVELIFVDDGSTDNSLNVLQSYKDRTSFALSIYSQENAGVCAARNCGIRHAAGDYITFIDVDDALTDDYLETLNCLIYTSNADVYVFQSMRVQSETPPILQSHTQAAPYGISRLDMLSRLLCNPTKYGVVNLLLRKAFLEKSGILFSVGYKYYEDYEFLFRVFGVANNIVITEKTIYFYMLRDGSAMQRFTSDRLLCLSLMKKLEPFFESQVPDFYTKFCKWGVPRIYWSVLWQACLAFPLKRDFVLFVKETNASEAMKKLLDFPDKKVRLSARLYTISPALYRSAVKVMSRGRSRVERTDISEFNAAFQQC